MNFVDHGVTSQSSILRVIEDNWSLARLGNQSFDALSGSIDNMFNFKDGDAHNLFLDPATGEPTHHRTSVFGKRPAPAIINRVRAS